MPARLLHLPHAKRWPVGPVALAVGLLCLWMGIAHAQGYRNAPVAGNMSSPFGWRADPISGQTRFHGGIDIAAPAGSPVYLPQAGRVTFSGPYRGYGNVVVVEHPGKVYTIYAHNAALYVRSGQAVQRGQVLAAVGSTGHSTGPHLHFEVRYNGSYVDPLVYLERLSAWERQAGMIGLAD